VKWTTMLLHLLFFYRHHMPVQRLFLLLIEARLYFAEFVCAPSADDTNVLVSVRLSLFSILTNIRL